MSKTPKFDAAIEKILGSLSPHDRTCRQCEAIFKIEPGDIEFYRDFKVPPPTLCPNCRLQQRLGGRISFLPVFYRRPCAAEGHTEQILSFYPPEIPLKVVDTPFYNGDGWDGVEYGLDYDPSKPFFGQLNRLEYSVPRQSLQQDPKSVNSDFIISGVEAKNCYYCAIPFRSEDCQYSYRPDYSKNIIDCNLLVRGESCYESINVEDSYNCRYCQDSNNCLDSWFLFDCKNCSNCFGCTNLRNKKYCFFNEQLTKEEYQERIAKINTGSRSQMEELIKRFEELKRNAIHRSIDAINVVDSVGNNFRNCSDCYHCFQITREGEHLRYVTHTYEGTDSMDMFGGTGFSRVYESAGITNAQNVKFCMLMRTGMEVEYSTECHNCDYIFGCVGLKNKKYCIFNKQYTEEEYWPRVDELKVSMLARGEYGEFFSLVGSSYPYNISNAMVYFPLSKEDILSRRWTWADDPSVPISLGAAGVLEPSQLPDNISSIEDSLLSQTLICERTRKPFRLTKFELDFYRTHNLPIPTLHPLERIKDRFAKQFRYRLWDAKCSKCGILMQSAYDPNRKLVVYCESCYQQEVI